MLLSFDSTSCADHGSFVEVSALTMLAASNDRLFLLRHIDLHVIGFTSASAADSAFTAFSKTIHPGAGIH